MAKFDDTPRAARQKTWDPVRQQLVTPDKPPTKKQVDFLRDICRDRGIEFETPKTRRDAARMLDALLKRKRRRRRSRSS